jgi:mannose-6-phosphate isomerase-like protein (cupin superfamily)
MQQLLPFFLFLLGLSASHAQQHLSLSSLSNTEDQNIRVQALGSTAHSSSFVIWVRDSVKAHYHEAHTETLLVLEGEASMLLGDSILSIKPNDFIEIPPKTVHAVWVKGKKELKVLSVQAPEFKGKDRLFVETEKH